MSPALKDIYKMYKCNKYAFSTGEGLSLDLIVSFTVLYKQQD